MWIFLHVLHISHQLVFKKNLINVCLVTLRKFAGRRVHVFVKVFKIRDAFVLIVKQHKY